MEILQFCTKPSMCACSVIFWFLKSFFMEINNPFILHSLYHGCWWPGNARSQGISIHGIDLPVVIPEYSCLTTRMAIVSYDQTPQTLSKGSIVRDFHGEIAASLIRRFEIWDIRYFYFHYIEIGIGQWCFMPRSWLFQRRHSMACGWNLDQPWTISYSHNSKCVLEHRYHFIINKLFSLLLLFFVSFYPINHRKETWWADKFW